MLLICLIKKSYILMYSSNYPNFCQLQNKFSYTFPRKIDYNKNIRHFPLNRHKRKIAWNRQIYVFPSITLQPLSVMLYHDFKNQRLIMLKLETWLLLPKFNNTQCFNWKLNDFYYKIYKWFFIIIHLCLMIFTVNESFMTEIQFN